MHEQKKVLEIPKLICMEWFRYFLRS